MTRAQTFQVRQLCEKVTSLCRVAEGGLLPEKGEPVGGHPKLAELKRASMDLTRALARLRGRGKF